MGPWQDQHLKEVRLKLSMSILLFYFLEIIFKSVHFTYPSRPDEPVLKVCCFWQHVSIFSI